MKNKAPDARVAAYVDDRTIWARGKGGVQQVDDAVRAAKHYDKLAALVWNEGKGASWSSTKEEAHKDASRVLHILAHTANKLPACLRFVFLQSVLNIPRERFI